MAWQARLGGRWRVRRFGWIAAVALAGTWTDGCDSWFAKDGTGDAAGPVARNDDGPRLYVARHEADLDVLRAEPMALPDRVADRYQLVPDRRCLAAYGIAAEMLARQETLVRTTLNGDQWHIVLGTETVALLPRMARLQDCFEALRHWLATVAPPGPLGDLLKGRTSWTWPAWREGEIQLDGLYAELRQLDRRIAAGQANLADLDTAIRTWTLLCLLTADEQELADASWGRALALAAMRQAWTEERPIHALALLADDMGYSQWAADLAASLAADDPVRLYIARELDELRSWLRANGYPAVGRMLLTMALARNDDYATWAGWVFEAYAGEFVPFDVQRSSLDLSPFVDAQFFGTWAPLSIHVALMRGVSDVVARASLPRRAFADGDPAAHVQALLAAMLDAYGRDGRLDIDGFYALVDRLAAEGAGPLMPPAAFATSVRALWMDAIDLGFRHRFTTLSSSRMALSYLESFGSPSEPALSDYLTTARMVARARGDEARPREYLQFLTNNRTATGRLARDAFDELDGIFPPTAPQLRPVFAAIVARLDLRPSTVDDLLRWAESPLASLEHRLAALTYLEDVRSRDDGELRIERAWATGDMVELARLAGAPVVDLAARAELAVDLYDVGHWSDEQAMAALQALVAAAPGRWAPLGELSGLYSERGRFAEKRALCQNWLDGKYLIGGLEDAYASACVGTASLRLGEPERAWEEVQAGLASGFAGGFIIAGEIRAALGDLAGARALFQRAAERYADYVHARVPLAKFEWQQGNDVSAATALGPAGRRQPWAKWQVEDDIAPAMLDVFRNQSPERAAAAMAALDAAAIHDHERTLILQAFFREELYDHVLAMAGEPPDTGRIGNTGMMAYAAMREVRGTEAANDWLRGRIQRDHMRTAITFWNWGYVDALWEVLTPPPADANDSEAWFWTLRAATIVQHGPRHAEDHAALAAYFSRQREGFVYDLGRYLLGDLDTERLFRHADTAKERAEASYFIGLKAACANLPHDAARWWQVTAEIGIPMMETVRANNALLAWAETGRSDEFLELACRS